jgi:hypothetical protein
VVEEQDIGHSTHSTLREKIVEHVFVGQLLQSLWQRGKRDMEVLKSEFDTGGYDVVVSVDGIIRHIQLKTKLAHGKSQRVTIHTNLSHKPSGCVVWIVISEDLHMERFLFFGSKAGLPLPDISLLETAKHTKCDATGVKNLRPMIKILPLSRFERIETLDTLIDRLFF